MLGEMLVVLAQAGLVAAVLLQKKIVETVDPLHMAALLGMMMGVASLPVLFYFARTSGVAIPQDQLKLTIAAGIIGGIAFVLMMEGMKRVLASKAVLISTSAFMLFGIVLSALYFGEMEKIATIRFAAGAILIATGVFVLGRLA